MVQIRLHLLTCCSAIVYTSLFAFCVWSFATIVVLLLVVLMCEIANHLTRSSKVSSTPFTSYFPIWWWWWLIWLSLLLTFLFESFRYGVLPDAISELIGERGSKCNDAIRLRFVILCNNNLRRRSLRRVLILWTTLPLVLIFVKLFDILIFSLYYDLSLLVYGIPLEEEKEDGKRAKDDYIYVNDNDDVVNEVDSYGFTLLCSLERSV